MNFFCKLSLKRDADKWALGCSIVVTIANAFLIIDFVISLVHNRFLEALDAAFSKDFWFCLYREGLFMSTLNKYCLIYVKVN